jgi:putative tricarboxylic transport membrane protein
MRLADLVTAVVLMLMGVLVLGDALRLGAGWGSDGPQSGFLPFWLAVLLLAVSLGIVVQAWRQRDGKPFVTREQLQPVLKVVLPMTVFVLLIDPPGLPHGLGLYVSGGLYMAFYMRWVGRHDWRAVIAMAVLVPIVTFVVFERWFLVPMPKGPLEAWLGY